MQPPPAEPGMHEQEVDTPALLLDLDAFEANLDAMAAALAPTGTKLRAHTKTHKSPVIARLQMERGAVGQCVQKVAEAEVLAWGGIPDILVTNEVVGPRKLARLAALNSISRVGICADDRGQVDAIAAAAALPQINITGRRASHLSDSFPSSGWIARPVRRAQLETILIWSVERPDAFQKGAV
jgi:D-serine deaminase-like pyridoxal phosphate-dependent protein